MADNELQARLARRTQINAGEAAPVATGQSFNPYTDFPEFSRKEVKDFQQMFKKYDSTQDGFLDLPELKYMMEKLDQAQTHVALKEMIKEVDEDNDGKISLREFFMIFRKAAKKELKSAGLLHLASHIDVSEEGVGGAKGFFEAKINQQSQSKKNEEEIKQEQAGKKVERQEKAVRKADFKSKASMFEQVQQGNQ